jgi:hypothetical protein
MKYVKKKETKKIQPKSKGTVVKKAFKRLRRK